MAMSDNVVFGYPYEGGLWYLLSRKNPAFAPPITGHAYYESLYGPDPLSARSQAANLAILFDQVLIPPADEYLPDHQTYCKDDGYFHPDLRIRVPLDWESERDLFTLAQNLIADEVIAKTLKIHQMLPNDSFQAQHLIQRTLAQIRLALKNDAVFIAGDGVAAFVRDLWPFIIDHMGVPDGSNSNPEPLIVGTETLNVVGLDWACNDLDALAVVRQSKQITQYGTEFRHILRSSSSATVRENLLGAMRKAMQDEDVAKMAHAAFTTTGVASTVAGVIPLLGTPAALLGLSTFLASKQAERTAEANRWYLLGARLREVDLMSSLKA